MLALLRVTLLNLPMKLRWKKILSYIKEGDIYQANMSRRFDAFLEPGVTPFEVFKKLRQVNPAPFSAFLSFGEIKLASASPERFISVYNNQVETKPIKGTRPRSKDLLQDQQLATDLLASEKERAENLMIVDLLRNDLSRVCLPIRLKHQNFTVGKFRNRAPFGLHSHWNT